MTGMQTNHPLASAVAEWDRRWQDEQGRAEWLEPEAEVVATAGKLHAAGARVALDIGCGIGRHALALAGLGYRVTAIDGSESGLAFGAADAARRGLNVDFRQAPMTMLPLPDGSCDYVLAWNVIYHGNRAVVDRCVQEIARVLKPGGTYQGTMLSKRNRRYGLGREVSADTFVIDAESDKAHPHFYCDARTLVEIFSGFEILSLADREHRQAGSFHWHLVATRS
jgi:tellurite methyltransferase